MAVEHEFPEFIEDPEGPGTTGDPGRPGEVPVAGEDPGWGSLVGESRGEMEMISTW